MGKRKTAKGHNLTTKYGIKAGELERKVGRKRKSPPRGEDNRASNAGLVAVHKRRGNQ